jgi:uroporphyrinogen decarboxylase
MSNMTGKERILTTLRLIEPDMVPTMDLVDSKVIEAILPGASQEDFAEYMDLDAVWFSDILHYWKYEIVDEEKKIMRDTLGGLAQITDHDWPITISPAIQSEAELNSYVPPDPNLPEQYEYARKLIKRFKGQKAILATIADVWALCREYFLGEMQFFRALITKPDLVTRANEILLDFQLSYMKNAIDLGADFFFIGGDWAMTKGPMASREHLIKFAAEPLKKMVDYAHSRSVPVIKHTDGNVWPIMDILLETGIDALNPIDPMAGMDMGEVKAKIGDKVCLSGNVDCAYLLINGTTDEVREATRECIRKGGKGGGFICMSSNTIHAKVKPENYVAMVKAVREFGRYPLEDHFNHLVKPGSDKSVFDK